MKRRDLLAAAVALFAAPAALRAEDEFDAFRRQLDREFRGREGEFDAFRSEQEREFARYRQELDAAFAAYSRSYAEATRELQRDLAAFWGGNAELSSRHRWVEYSADKAVQRVVDFERNEVRLSVRTDRLQASEALVRQQLEAMLNEDQATAVARDPVTRAVEQAVGKAGPNATERAPVSNQRVLGELFDKPKPSAREVEAKAQQLAQSAKRESAGEHVVVITVPLPPDRPLRKAEEYRDPVSRYAKEWKVEPALLYAVIHTESSFNPLARSPIPAYGLMQIVPKSAGQDATKLIYGQAKVVAPSYLYDGDKNIRLGAAYLHLLMYRYLKDVADPESRLYCAIAAYNTGSGNVARAFVGSTNVAKAAETINRRKPREVYDHLVANLPYDETRQYVRRVVARIATYRS